LFFIIIIRKDDMLFATFAADLHYVSVTKNVLQFFFFNCVHTKIKLAKPYT